MYTSVHSSIFLNMEEANFMENSPNEMPAKEQIHQCHFLKFQSHDQHLKLKARFKEAQKLVEKWNQDRNRINEELRKKLVHQNCLSWSLSRLSYKDQGLKASIAYKRRQLDPLQVALDKLCCGNKAYQVGPIFSGGELNPFSFHHRMLHKTKNLAEEKQLLREINASQRTAVSSCLSLEELNYSIHSSYQRMESLEWERRSSAEKKHFLREIKDLEVKRDNMISNANLKGKILDSLGSKEAIKTQIKLIRTELDGMKKKQQSVKAEIEQAEKEMEAMEMYIGSLQERLVAINQERKGAVKHLNELRKQCDKAKKDMTSSFVIEFLMTCYKEGCCCPRQT